MQVMQAEHLKVYKFHTDILARVENVNFQNFNKVDNFLPNMTDISKNQPGVSYINHSTEGCAQQQVSLS